MVKASLEHFLLRRISTWSFSPFDENYGVFEAAKIAIDYFRADTEGRGLFINTQRVNKEIERLKKFGYIEADWVREDTWHNVALTKEGESRLEYLKSQRPSRLFVAWFGRLLDGAFKSVFLPIVVSVLTVLALRYFGLHE